MALLLALEALKSQTEILTSHEGLTASQLTALLLGAVELGLMV